MNSHVERGGQAMGLKCLGFRIVFGGSVWGKGLGRGELVSQGKDW